MRKQTEASMLVTGAIVIEPDGHVGSYQVDQAEKLPPAATGWMAKAVSAWKFQPIVIDGKAVRARTRMSVRIVAKSQGDGRYEVRLASASFGEDGAPGEFVSSKELKPPSYPQVAAMSGVRGTVYVVVRIGRDGRVEDAIAEQVNLKVVDSEAGMTRWRNSLAKAAVLGARKWTFNPPTQGEEVDKPFWLARVPVDFYLNDEKPASYGQWEAYIPGPRQSTPWMGAMDASLGADAVAGGGMHPIGAGPKLLTPLDGT
ncbi:TonB family protein [Lysobacter niastensis]|uniref:TonB family protein n=1 Tax=Lysobacter niastensis TaxID=380629 RepID=A0ABU1WDA8_9GAMM|nr:energy transducer TonB [Lysobacter niastensis]MDR7135575.1 TonB family protein [Lysobacter niastensis]